MREPSGLARISGLDGIRGLAVLSVIAFHFYFAGRSTLLGALGVEFFFVLSGFLITGILLKVPPVERRRTADSFYCPTLLYQEVPAYISFVLFGSVSCDSS
jgi:peptidoglycan/LPS O-acetylase OafA/YrhL